MTGSPLGKSVPLISGEAWARVGRGLGVTIPGASWRDVAPAVATLPPSWSPYMLVAASLEKYVNERGRVRYRGRADPVELDEMWRGEEAFQSDYYLALHNPRCRRGLNPPVSRRDLAT